MHAISVHFTEDSEQVAALACGKGPVLWKNWRILVDLSEKAALKLSKQQPVLYIQTDYFGGCGEQSAQLLSLGKKTRFKTINQALSKIGVQATTRKDEFDVIGLGMHRDNESFLKSKPPEIKPFKF
jgi:hypothetical protein